MGIGVASYQSIMERVEKNYYATLEQDLLLAGNDYFSNHREDKPLTGYNSVDITSLIGKEYIETLKENGYKGKIGLGGTNVFNDLKVIKEDISLFKKYIDFYNDYRPHQRLGYLTPNQTEEEYYKSQLDESTT